MPLEWTFPHGGPPTIHQPTQVAEVTAIGIPDDYRGQSVKAFVVLKGDKTLTGDELRAFLEDKLAKHAMPREIEFRDELPKTMIGKLSKKELVAEEQEKYEKAKAAGGDGASA